MTPTDINELFTYADGALYWKRLPRKRFGSRAGRLMPSGYVVIRYRGRRYRAHRLIWILLNGPIPTGMQVDHVDRNRSNNRPENLRLVTTAGNARNRCRYRTNKSGVRGVCWHKGMKKWVARIYPSPYKMVVLGYSASLDEAARMRREAEKKYGYL